MDRSMVRLRSREKSRMDDEQEETFCPETDAERRDFLTVNLHILCSRIQPRKFYLYLRSSNVLDHYDQQELENKYHTDVERAVELIEKVKKQGRHAFQKFMTVLEYKYSELYEELTDLPPRPVPSEWVPRVSTHFSSLNAVAVALEQLLVHRINDSEYAKQHIMAMKNRLSTTEEDATKELEDLEDKLFDYKQKLQKTTEENEKLNSQLMETKKNESNYKIERDRLQQELTKVNFELKNATGEAKMHRETSKRYKNENEAYRSRSMTQKPESKAEKTRFESEFMALKEENSAQQEQIDRQKEEIERLRTQVDKKMEELSHLQSQYETLEDDFKGEKTTYEKAIENQNIVFRIIQDQCVKLEKDKKLLQEELARREDPNANVHLFPDFLLGTPPPRPRASPVSPHHRRPPKLDSDSDLKFND